jgi:hypothetical protein
MGDRGGVNRKRGTTVQCTVQLGGATNERGSRKDVRIDSKEEGRGQSKCYSCLRKLSKLCSSSL